jgi:Protein of unknown function (DUF5672)
MKELILLFLVFLVIVVSIIFGSSLLSTSKSNATYSHRGASSFSRSQYEPNIDSNNQKRRYGAVIIEPRKHEYLEFILSDFDSKLPVDVGLSIFHTSMNDAEVKTVHLNEKRSVQFTRLESIVAWETIIADDKLPNTLLLNESFYDFIPYERFIVFQVDSIFCKPVLMDELEPFFKFDYLGSPWAGLRLQHYVPTALKGGNGGLSIRSKQGSIDAIKIRKDLIEKNPLAEKWSEDIYFSNSMELVNHTVAPLEIAKKFAVETYYYSKPIGVHKPWLYLPKAQILSLLDFCTGLGNICPTDFKSWTSDLSLLSYPPVLDELNKI